MKQKVDKFWPTYTKVPVGDQWFAEFTHYFTIKDEDLGRVREMFDSTLLRQFRNKMQRAKKGYLKDKSMLGWIHQSVQKDYIDHWQSEKFNDRSKINTANRNHVDPATGRKVAKNTCGSRSSNDTRVYMERKLKRVVFSWEFVSFYPPSPRR